MDADRLAQIQDLFHAVLERPTEDRNAFLQAACPDDPDLRAAVERYLAADADGFSLIDEPIAHVKDMDQELPALEGRQVGPYHIERKLGGGGMGVVYLAYDPRLDRRVALKFLPPRFSTNEEAKARFIHEAKAASALDHTNICTIHDIGQTGDERLFIAMAFYEGQTLKKKIK